jgi:hydroxycarboxylate dehydrogenase B
VPLVDAAVLAELTTAIFTRLGAPRDLAAQVGDVLADNHLAGHDSHGILRIPQYVAAIRAGTLIPSARPDVVRESSSTALVDGHGAFGQVTANLAADVLATKAAASGVAAVAALQAGHTGRLAAFTERAARRGVVTFMAIGTVEGPLTVPFGGREPTLGTNPIACSIPNGDEPPITIDFATSAIAAGKVKVARARGTQVPAGSIVDAAGRPSTDPADFFAGGALLPFGGHKGYALAVVAELLGWALTGADEHAELGAGSGVFLWGVAAGAFRDEASYRRSVASIVDRIRSVPPADGFERVLVPGDPEIVERRRREIEGVPVPEPTWEQVVALAEEVGVDTVAFAPR